jgi:hypothetical protein
MSSTPPCSAITVFLHGHADIADSYGLVPIELLRHLAALGCPVNAHLRPGGKYKNLPDEFVEMTSRNLPSRGGIFIGWPTNFADHNHHGFSERPRIAITMFESSKLPTDWPDILNDFDAIVVPGKFCAELFRDNGITAPIHIVPLGVGEAYRPEGRSLHPDRPITFLTFADRGWRKGGMTAQNAFLRAFGDDTRYHLIIKYRQPLVRAECLNPNITLVQEDLTPEEMCQLYLRADVMICATRGEGFGLLPREFAATGGIALATNWSGTADDQEMWGWPLPYTMGDAVWGIGADPIVIGEGQWAEPDEVRISQYLRHVADNIDAFRQQALAKAPGVIEKYQWRKFAEGVLAVWQQVSERVAA